MPERFDLSYIAPDGDKKRPVMLHRAVFGSLERFIGILIEHYAGNFPLWLAPVQVAVLPITSDVNDYADKVRAELAAAGFRVELDASDETLNKKIRNAEHRKIPYMCVVGGKEAEGGTVALRRHKKGQVGVLPVADAIARLSEEKASRSLGE
jgi:threonyl-tRNA synthetase